MPGNEKRVRVRFHPLTEGPLDEMIHLRTDANSGSPWPDGRLGSADC